MNFIKKYTVSVKNGVLKIPVGVHKSIRQEFKGKNLELEMVFKKQTTPRSLEQNSYYWKCIVNEIAKEIGDDTESVHDALKRKFLGTEKRAGLVFTRSTTTLTKIEFVEYIENVEKWAFNFLNLDLRRE